MRKESKKLSIIAYFLFISITINAQGYFGHPLEGETSGSFNNGNCKVSAITIKYKLGSLVGEPTVYLNIRWQAGNGSSIDCLNNEPFEVFLKIQPQNTGLYFYLPVRGGLGVIPKGDNTWGYNPISGSPDWDELFISSEPANDEVKYLTKDYAKSIWKNGLTVTKVIFLFSNNGNQYSIGN